VIPVNHQRRVTADVVCLPFLFVAQMGDATIAWHGMAIWNKIGQILVVPVLYVQLNCSFGWSMT
jgi:hypothetical protein